MIEIHEKYVVDDKGRKTAVIINIEEFEAIKKAIKYLEDYDCLDINYNIAKGLKDIEEGKVHPIEKLFEEEKNEAYI